MNPVNQAQLKSFAESFDLVDESESDQFELYSIYAILNGGSGENVDPFEAHLKSTEFGLDGVAIIIQGNLISDVDQATAALEDVSNAQIDFYFFQAKTSSSFDYGEARKFFDAVDGFMSGEMAGESDQLDDLIAAKDYIYQHGVGKRNPGIFCFYATTGRFEPSSSKQLRRLIQNTQDAFSEAALFDEQRMQISMVGAAELQRLYRAAVTASQVRIEFKDAVVLPEHESVDEGYIGFISADELLKIVTVSDDEEEVISLNKAVFFDNIRDYNPNSKINREIAASLERGEQSNFIYRNNGITVVAKTVDRTGNNFRIEDFQVVNGCQTSNVLFHNRKNINGVKVPFRLIGTKNEDFIFSIISGTNKQNPVRDEQFWSLLPFMKNLEEYARKASGDRHVFLERRENQYRSETVERARIVQMQPFYKAYTAALLGLPHRAARNYRNEIDSRDEIIFAEEADVRPAYAAAFLHYRMEFLWRNQKIPADTKIYRYYIMDAASRQVLGGRAFMTLKPASKVKFASELSDLAADEKRMKKLVSSVDKRLDRQVAGLGIGEDSRERLRDAIRSSDFASEAIKSYTPKSGLI
ncbi:AIPR family protein [Qipengyuania sp.]|uniref:AIPR family protein n=1 Tax=Qipengyuania sp. TaxID=2004515 RepID=UPI003AF570C3